MAPHSGAGDVEGLRFVRSGPMPAAMKGAPVPDIATLRAICHAGKLAKDRRPWYSFFRWVSSYLSWLVLHTGLLPNHITMMSVACAILGTVLLATPSPRMALWGGFAFLLHHLLDKVDGDVARIRKIYSLAGVYLDELGHSFAFAGIFAGLALHLAWRTQGTGQVIIVLLAGTIGALSIVLARQNKSMGFLLFAQNVLTQPELLPAERPAQAVHVLSREAVLQHREAGGAGHRGWLSALRDAVLVVAGFNCGMLLAVAG